MTFDHAEIGRLLGYSFSDNALLREALTHASSVVGTNDRTYQRLEFLGDRVLGLVVADMLYTAFPDADEGELSRRLTQLVRGETCARVSREIGIGPHILLGDGEQRSRAWTGKGILSNVCESLIGAMFLDGGLEAAETFIERHWQPLMMERGRPLRDPKTMLQEWAHQADRGVPVYRTLERDGPDHAPRFIVEVSGEGIDPERGEGKSKRSAEQEAARAVLERHGVLKSAEAKPA